jgi:hypothetical protein
MILIYTDSEVIDREWIPHLALGDINITHSLPEYLVGTATHKLAFTAHRMHLSYDPDPDAYVSFEHKVQQLSQNSDLVFCIESELHHYHWAMYDQCHAQNVYWCQPGLVNDQPDMQQHIIFWGDWFKTTAMVYKTLTNQLAALRPFDVKPQSFDALLGSPKPHRDFVARAVEHSNLQKQIILTYGGDWKDTEFYARDYFIWEPDCVPQQNIIGTADWVSYHGHQCHLSQVIPQQVYNNTAYTIIAETDCDNTLSFYSEKTAKAFIARRLFVAFSGYKFLENLHELGFKTFGTVIDESYDLEPDFDTRMALAFEQVRRLCELPQQEIFEKIRPVVEHNYNLIMRTDWTRHAVDKIRARIHSRLG